MTGKWTYLRVQWLRGRRIQDTHLLLFSSCLGQAHHGLHKSWTGIHQNESALKSLSAFFTAVSILIIYVRMIQIINCVLVKHLSICTYIPNDASIQTIWFMWRICVVHMMIAKWWPNDTRSDDSDFRYLIDRFLLIFSFLVLHQYISLKK